ncbi:unnamed protein product [Protopolystoma xenopodis]|uniref:Uncharacterized protein n=1 Tax=Protopolystoma xenopodis TaxID=117903 RepID=A0A3S5FGK0_9PLAT|nr:unnamed protein product [Protopolystoma xenopodis]
MAHGMLPLPLFRPTDCISPLGLSEYSGIASSSCYNNTLGPLANVQASTFWLETNKALDCKDIDAPSLASRIETTAKTISANQTAIENMGSQEERVDKEAREIEGPLKFKDCFSRLAGKLSLNFIRVGAICMSITSTGGLCIAYSPQQTSPTMNGPLQPCELGASSSVCNPQADYLTRKLVLGHSRRELLACRHLECQAGWNPDFKQSDEFAFSDVDPGDRGTASSLTNQSEFIDEETKRLLIFPTTTAGFNLMDNRMKLVYKSGSFGKEMGYER